MTGWHILAQNHSHARGCKHHLSPVITFSSFGPGLISGTSRDKHRIIWLRLIHAIHEQLKETNCWQSHNDESPKHYVKQKKPEIYSFPRTGKTKLIAIEIRKCLSLLERERRCTSGEVNRRAHRGTFLSYGEVLALDGVSIWQINALVSLFCLLP